MLKSAVPLTGFNRLVRRRMGASTFTCLAVSITEFCAVDIHAPEMVYDLPAEGRRLVQKVDGYRYTICSGEVTYEDGAPTGALPGKLVRGPQALPVS